VDDDDASSAGAEEYEANWRKYRGRRGERERGGGQGRRAR